MLTITAALAYNAILIIAMIVLQVLLATPQLGLSYLTSARDEGRQLSGVAARIERAVLNATIGYALFAPAVLALLVTDQTSEATVLAANLYLWARVVYFMTYSAGVPWARTISWLTGVGATVWLWSLFV